MITPICDKCGKEFEEFGALAFSPPKNDLCLKYHICKTYWDKFVIWLKTAME